MRNPHSQFRLVLPLLIACCGCAQTATFRQIKPAQIDAGIRRLVVLDTAGKQQWTTSAEATLLSELRNSGFYSITTEADLLPHVTAPLRYQDGSVNRAILLEAARRLGAEAILDTHLRFVEANGQPYGSVSIRIGDPKITAAMHFELIEVITGRTIAKDVARSESYKGEFEDVGHDTEQRVLSRLGANASARLVNMLAPHEEVVEVPVAMKLFGPESSEIRAGTRAAQRGEWIEAMEHWHAAVAENGESDVAWYNLGLAYEATGDFHRAQQAFENATSIDDQEMYLDASRRVEFAADGVRIAQLQRSRPPRNESLGPFATRPQRQPPAQPLVAERLPPPPTQPDLRR